MSAFRPLKSGWKKGILDLECRRTTTTEAVTKDHVAPILKTVVEQIKQKTVISGFKACGLVPWHSDNIDFSKCLGRNSKKSADNELSKTTHATPPSITLEQFHQIVGDYLLEKFKTIVDVLFLKDMSSEFFKLYRLWETKNRMVEQEKNERNRREKKLMTTNRKKKSALLPSTKVSYGQPNK